MSKRKEKNRKRNSVQELLGIQHFTDYGLMTDAGELVFFRVAPTNISVLSSVNIAHKITGLTALLKLEPDNELLKKKVKRSRERCQIPFNICRLSEREAGNEYKLLFINRQQRNQGKILQRLHFDR